MKINRQPKRGRGGKKGNVQEKWDIPAEHLRETDLIRWRDLSFGARPVYFFLELGFLVQHHLSLAANRGAGMELS